MSEFDLDGHLQSLVQADASGTTVKPKAAWTAQNWQQNPGLMVNARPQVEAAMSRHGLKDDFFNAKDPQMAIQSEKPEHRRVILMAAHGMDKKSIAEATGYKPSYVSVILRQPWARAMLSEILGNEASAMHTQFLQRQVLPSLMVCADIRDDENAPVAVRLAAANSLIDRARGKPTQHIQTQVLPPVAAADNAKEQLDELRRRQAEIAAAQQRLLGTTLPATPALAN